VCPSVHATLYMEDAGAYLDPRFTEVACAWQAMGSSEPIIDLNVRPTCSLLRQKLFSSTAPVSCR
jgi:hypothetical protein